MKERLFDLLNQTRKLKQLFMVCALLLLPLGTRGQAVFDGGGDGTQNSPYIIQSATDLLRLSTWINDGTLQGDEYFEVDANAYQIDCSTLTTFQPVGTANRPFRGSFKGHDILISNLTVNASSDDCNGFFGYIDGGTVNKLRLSRCTFTGGSDCGAVAGRLVDGTIENCTVASCSLTSGNAQNVNAGGVVGQANKGTITGCQVDGTPIIGSSTFATASGSSRVGGIVGYANSTDDIYVTSCQVTSVAGETTILSKHSAPTEIIAGGIVGSCSDGYSNFNGNTVTAKNEVTVNCQNPANSTNVVVKCGAIVGVVGGAAFINNTYEYGVTTSITDAQGATTTRLAYQSRGTGSEDASNSSYDIFPDNGALMYTKWVYLPPETEQGSASAGDADLQYQHSNSSSSEMYVAPGQTAYFSVTPFAGYYPSSVKAQYEGTTIDATFVRYDSGIYYYTFEMPDANVTVDATFTQGTAYDLFVGGTQVTEANADDVLGDGTVSFYTSGGQEAAPTYTLVLDGATLTKPVQVGLPNLTIDLHGANTITTKTTCIQNIAANVVPSLTFDSNADQVGSLTLKNTDEDFTGVISDSYYGYFTISKKLALILERYGNTYSNEYYFTAGEVHDALLAPSYGVQIGNMLIYEGNAADVTGYGIGDGAEGGMVSFNKETSTLTLTNASLSGGICTSLPELTVELVGDNTLYGDGNYPVFRSITGDNVTITIQSTAEVTGSLTVNVPSAQAGKACEDEVTLDIKDPLAVVSGSLTDNHENSNTVVIAESLGLAVAGVPVSKLNAEDVLGDGKVSFNADNNTLTLKDATIDMSDEDSFPIVSNLANLTINIVGYNTITVNPDYPSFVQYSGQVGEAAPTLTFDTKGYMDDGLYWLGDLTINGITTQAAVANGYAITNELETITESITHENADNYATGWKFRSFSANAGVNIGYVEVYDLWIGNGRVISSELSGGQADDAPKFIPVTQTLEFFQTKTAYPIKSSMPELVVSIYDECGVTSKTTPAISFQPTQAQPTGKLRFVIDDYAANDIQTKNTLTLDSESGAIVGFSEVVYESPLALVKPDAVPNVWDENTKEFIISDTPVEYDIWVKDIRVNNKNKSDVLGDNTESVRFNSLTNTLSFYNANIKTTGDVPVVKSGLADGLTVDLRGTSIISFKKGFVSEIADASLPLTFITDATGSGQLSWTMEDGGAFSEGFTVNYQAPLEKQSGNLIAKTEIIDYDLAIGTTVVNSLNCRNVLNVLNSDDNATVKYVDETKTLVLDNATLTDLPIVSGLDKLTIHLIGKSTIIGSQNLISSTDPAAKLTFITNSSEPGKLELSKTEDSGEWISGFASLEIPLDFAETPKGNALTIAHAAPITPIVQDPDDGNAPQAEVSIDTPPAGIDDDNVIINEVIGNVLHTLSSNTDGFDEGSDKGILLNSTVSEDNLLDALKKLPGSQEFAELFKGLTFMIPAGTGTVAIQCLIASGYKLAVKIGDDDPIILPNDQYPTVDALADIQLPYTCDVPTYVYIYLPGTAAPARTSGSNREKVLTGNVKVTTVGASSSSIVSTNSYSDLTNTIKDEAKLFVLPAEAVTGDGTGVVLSTIDVSSSGSTNPSRGDRRAAELKPITELAPSVFDGLNKSEIRYVDISGTAIKDFAVNRSSGLMSGFGSNTLIYMPEGNDNGGEDNVIIDGTCASLSLADDNGFRAPKDFKATKAQLQREFTQSQTSTVFLPFALTAAQAEALGTFHTFKEMKGGDAVFNAALTTGTEANTPYIFIPAIDGAKFQADDVEVKLLNKSTATVGNMIGTYEKISWDAEQTDIYGFAAAKTDDNRVKAGQFVRVDDGAWVPPFRAYLKVTSTESRLNIVIDDEITGVKEVNEVSEVNDNSVYSISGQRIQKPTKGMYIINGKKVLVK